MRLSLDIGSSGGGFRPGWLISSILTGAMEKLIEFNETWEGREGGGSPPGGAEIAAGPADED